MTRSRLLLVAAVSVAALARPAAAADPFDRSDVPVEVLPTDPKLAKVVLIAGPAALKTKSGEHEYFAGCALLARMLRQTPGVVPVLVRDGWPKNPDTLKGAKAVVLFLEGGAAHSLSKGDRLRQIQKLTDAGAGIVHLHSAIDYPTDLGDRARQTAGAAWEKGHSLRAHWVATFDKFPDHPVCRGVTPFTINDGWLWKLRFADGMAGVTPLLRTTRPKAPAPGGADEAVVSWVYERPGGGRAFAFTGCHLHESWKLDGYRRLIVNGILWSAGRDIPAGGAPVVLDPADLSRHLDRKPARK